jgi:hypothetical protein
MQAIFGRPEAAHRSSRARALTDRLIHRCACMRADDLGRRTNAVTARAAD